MVSTWRPRAVADAEAVAIAIGSMNADARRSFALIALGVARRLAEGVPMSPRIAFGVGAEAESRLSGAVTFGVVRCRLVARAGAAALATARALLVHAGRGRVRRGSEHMLRWAFCHGHVPAARTVDRAIPCADAPDGTTQGSRRPRALKKVHANVPCCARGRAHYASLPFRAVVRGYMKALALRQLTKTYRNGVQALKGIDLDVEEGDFFALLGPNGAGKTTAIGIVSSLVTKTSGNGDVFGHDIDPELEAAKTCLGVVPQEINFNQFEKVSTILLNQAGFYGIPRTVAKGRVEYWLKQLQLWDKRDAISRSFSGGMKRRLMIARALIHEPRLLILDEPTAGVDIEVRRSMWEFLRRINEQGTTIILTTHYLEEAESLCRHIAIIDEGRIIENDRMSTVLRKLHTETFVLNLRKPLAELPPLPGYRVLRTDETTLEVEVNKEQNLNEIFAALTGAGIEVRQHAQQGEPSRGAVPAARRRPRRRQRPGQASRRWPS